MPCNDSKWTAGTLHEYDSLAVLQADGTLGVASLGDCALRVFRGASCVFETEVCAPHDMGAMLVMMLTPAWCRLTVAANPAQSE